MGASVNGRARYATYPSLQGRVVLITGGASGIGASIVEAFAAQSSRVIFLDINAEAGHQLATTLSERGQVRPEFLACDVTDIQAMQRVLAPVLQQFGQVDVLVNNAGNDTRHTIEGVTPESWDRSMAINLKHQFFMSQAVLPGMKKAGSGSIINMSSISWAIPSTGLPLYVTAKAAIVGMTRTMAHELGADNIRVNCVMPGAIVTERQQRLWFTDEYKAKILESQALRRFIFPDEVARLVLFLAADDSAAITNQSYIIDAGWV